MTKTAQKTQLILHLAEHPEGVPLASLPVALRAAELLESCDAEGLIIFGQRQHSFTGAGELLLEDGWRYVSLAGRSRLAMVAFLEAMSSPDLPEELRCRVRLTAAGHVLALRLAVETSELAEGETEGETVTIDERAEPKRKRGRPRKPKPTEPPSLKLRVAE